MLRNRIEVSDPAESARRIVSSPEALSILAKDKDGLTVLRAAEMQRRSASLRPTARNDRRRHHDLARAATCPDKDALDIRRRVISQAEQRRLAPGDEVDIPLIRGDGSFQVVELKRAAGAKLVKEHRGSWVPRREVHDAIGQAINYLVGLDENRERILEEFGVDTRRARALVLVGHPSSQPEVSEREINEALRIHTSHLNRIEVLTYKELVDSAERALALGEPA